MHYIIMTSSTAASRVQPKTSPAGVKSAGGGGGGRANVSAAAASAEAAGRKAAEEEVQRLNGEVSSTFLSVAD